MIDYIAQNIYTNVTRSELQILHDITKENKSDVCVEIGSYYGASSLAMASALKAAEKLYCIDIWQSNPAMRPDPGMVERYKALFGPETSILDVFRHFTAPYKDNIQIIQDYSYNAVNQLSGLNIDILFIDGDHSFEGVKKDWDLFKPLMPEGSFVLFHDWGWGSVKKMIQEYVIPKTKNHNSIPNLWWGQIA